MKKNIFQYWILYIKTGMLFLFFLVAGLLPAQGQEYRDTIVPLPAEPDTETIQTEAQIDTDEEEVQALNEYFLDKWAPGSGMDSVKLRKVNDTSVALMRKDKDFWYANEVFDKKETESSSGEYDSSGKGFEPLLWILIIGGFIAFLVIYLSNSNVSLFRKTRTIDQEEPDGENDDIFAINYQKEIDKAVNAGNHRLAVRLLFLRLLRSLSDKEVIQYRADKTNFDYLLQLQHTRWYQHFFRLTRNYEYVWYGLFDIDREKFDKIRNDFSELDRQLQ